MFSKELKLTAIKDYYKNLGFTEVTNKYDIKDSAILYEWIRKVEQ